MANPREVLKAAIAALDHESPDGLEKALWSSLFELNKRQRLRFWRSLLSHPVSRSRVTGNPNALLWSTVSEWTEEEEGDASQMGGFWAGIVSVTKRYVLLLTVDHQGFRELSLETRGEARRVLREAQQECKA